MLTFANSLFLFALAGLAVPVILHLINRELAVDLKFPSVRFIHKARLPRREKRRLRDLLLLLLRLALFAAVVLAFAQPIWITPVPATAEERQLRQTVYVLDASSSMAGDNAWPEAVSAIEAEVADRPDEQAGLVVFAEKVLVQVEPSHLASAIGEVLSRVEPSYAAGSPALALEHAVRLFHPEAKTRLVVVSDFQETDWQTDLPGVPRGVELVLLPVSESPGPNTGIVNVNVHPIGKNLARVMVSLRNYGDRKVETRLSLSGPGIAEEKTRTLEGGQLSTVSFEVDASESQPMRVFLPEDGYERDNSWHFWVSPPPEIRVMAFLPHLDEPEVIQGFYFLQTALEVESETDWIRFDVTAVDRGFFHESMLEEAEVMVFPATGAYFKDEQWDYLRSFLEPGGTALMLPGASFPKLFRNLQTRGFMQSRFLGLAGNTSERLEPFHFGQISPNSALADVFAREAAKDLYLVNVYRYVRLHLHREDTSLLSFENGDAALIALPVGKGKLFVSTFAFDPGWTDLPLRNSFLPLVRELLEEGFDVERQRNRLFVEEAAPHLAEGMDRPGTLDLEGQLWEINVNPSESTVARVDTRQWLPSVLTEGPIQVAQASLENPLGATGGQDKHLWPWFLMFALTALFLESLWVGLADPIKSSRRKKVV